MPSFLSSFRSKSRLSIKPEKSASNLKGQANGDGNGNGIPNATSPVKRNKSSSTLNSALGSTTPPTSEDSASQTNRTIKNNTPPPLPNSRPNRPSLSTNGVKRYSMNGATLQSAGTSTSQKSLNPSSFLAPQILSVSDGSWVNQKILLIFGRIGEPSHRPLDGMVVVHHHMDSFPATSWPVHDNHFKALIHLSPGTNRLRFDFTSPKVSTSSTSIPAHTSFLNVNYLPLNGVPPLQLAIIIGKDSPGTFDSTPDRMQREGNDMEIALRKFRMAAYLWQAFTGEQMTRHGFGRRCFRFDEEWQHGTLSFLDWDTGVMRNEAKIHIIRSDKTVAEIRDLDLAQQYDKAQKNGDLFGIAAEAVQQYFQTPAGQKQYVSCLFLDAHWDTNVKTIVGHAALGGGVGDLQLAIFGSQALHSYPSCLEEVPLAFTDCTPTDTAYVANDCNESGSNWEAANIGIGAHLHETGHLFGCPHQESGVMLRDYVRLNRTFCTRESFSTRTKSRGQQLVLPEDECGWHHLDTLRFRFHPCFRLPIDPPVIGDGSVQVWTVDNGQGGVIATAASGIAWIELFTDGDDLCHSWIKYHDGNGHGSPGSGFPRQIALIESELRDRLPKEKQKSRLKLEIFSAGGGNHVVEDFGILANNKRARVRIPDGRWGYRSSKLGYSQMEGSEPQEIILECAYIQTKLLLTIRVWCGIAVDGIEFIYEDTSSQLFGKRGGHSEDFALDTRRGELLMGFTLRTGLWIDALQVLTSLGRKSKMFGKADGGSSHTLIPPRGYTIGGISGSCAKWLDGFSLIITR